MQVKSWLALAPVALGWISAAGCAAGASQTPSPVAAGTWIKAAIDSEHLDRTNVALVGKIFIPAPRSVFLADPGFMLEGDSLIPPDTACLQLLLSERDALKMASLNAKLVRVEGEVHYLPKVEGMTASVSVRNRSSVPYCQYTASHTPILYVTRIEVAKTLP